MILLEDLLNIGGTLASQPTCQQFSDFSYDSRCTQPGEVFVALHTSRADGHDYIPSALAAGATGVICSWPPRNTEGATIILTENPEHLIQQWAAQHLQKVNPTVIAITGSVGKTSTKHAIDNVLSTKKPTFASRQSFNSLFGLPIALARLQEKHRFAVLEFGSDHFGEIEHLARLFPPHIGVVTNIGQAHLKSFGTLEGVAQEKSMLIKALPSDGWAVLNLDDPYVAAMRSQTNAHILTYGQESASDLQASHISYFLHETRFHLTWHGHKMLAFHPQKIEVTIPLIGEPAIPIALATISVALVCGMSLDEAGACLSMVQPFNGRLRILPAIHQATLVDDTFNASLPSILAALRTMRALPAQRRIVILGHLADQSNNVQADYQTIGELAGSVADILICKGDWGTIATQAARQINPTIKTHVVYTATSALQALPTDLGLGDLILVKGSAEARMERIAAGLLDPSGDATQKLVRQEPSWHAVRIGTPDRPTSVQIDLDAVARNVQCLRSIAGVPLMAVVKGDAYGHGAVRVSRTALTSGATALAVATLSEARTLREADITAPILVLGYTPPWQAREAILLGVTCAIFEPDVAQAFSQAAVDLNRQAVVHVKVDTGMGRLGISPDHVCAFLATLRNLPNLSVEGLYSHFATADSADETFARIQLSRFQATLNEITAYGLRPPIVHMANSAALLRFPEARFDMVRTGIACYGLNPSNETPLPPACQPVLSFYTELAQVKSVPKGSSLSYGCTFVTQQASRIATIPIGYADGFRRSPPWREVLVRGQRAPVVGRICMDYTLIDVTHIEGAKRGDPVVIVGKQGQDEITADEVASWLGTINYEVVSAILPRVPREVRE